VAIKKLLGTWYKDTDMVQRFRDEILLMSTMHHPNVLVFLGAVLDPEAGNMCLVTELCRNGTLWDYVHSNNPMDWRVRLRMCLDIARGMHYLHGRAGIIQRDLKSANLLLDDFLHVKIADFGLSRQMNTTVMETYCGTPATMAPEIVMQQPYSEKADVFSFAIIMWEILTRKEPYEGRAGLGLAMAVANEGIRPPVPAYCPAEWAALMTQSWAQDANERPSFEDILDRLSSLEVQVDAALRGAPVQAADTVEQREAAIARVMQARNKDFEAMQANIARKKALDNRPRGFSSAEDDLLALAGVSSDDDEKDGTGEGTDELGTDSNDKYAILPDGQQRRLSSRSRESAPPPPPPRPSLLAVPPTQHTFDERQGSPGDSMASLPTKSHPPPPARGRSPDSPPSAMSSQAASPLPMNTQQDTKAGPQRMLDAGADYQYAASRARRVRRHTVAQYRSYEEDAAEGGQK
jgi:serine/threonine protein kinase